ncbi:MAG: hypothetical protein CL663_02960 [Bacteroidetes bacterium]|nr:hypothetical protein [Bacteroidota bacterium]
MTKVLLYGYGNPGRQDDGLGNAFIDRIEEWIKEEGLENIELDSNYQLNIEDAEAISNYDIAIFIDASVEEIDDFCVTKVSKESEIVYTTHAASPGYIYDLCIQIYGQAPPTFLVHIKGYEWAFKEGLTENGVANLEKAIEFMKPYLKSPEKLLGTEADPKPCYKA